MTDGRVAFAGPDALAAAHLFPTPAHAQGARPLTFHHVHGHHHYQPQASPLRVAADHGVSTFRSLQPSLPQPPRKDHSRLKECVKAYLMRNNRQWKHYKDIWTAIPDDIRESFHPELAKHPSRRFQYFQNTINSWKARVTSIKRATGGFYAFIEEGPQPNPLPIPPSHRPAPPDGFDPDTLSTSDEGDRRPDEDRSSGESSPPRHKRSSSDALRNAPPPPTTRPRSADEPARLPSMNPGYDREGSYRGYAPRPGVPGPYYPAHAAHSPHPVAWSPGPYPQHFAYPGVPLSVPRPVMVASPYAPMPAYTPHVMRPPYGAYPVHAGAADPRQGHAWPPAGHQAPDARRAQWARGAGEGVEGQPHAVETGTRRGSSGERRSPDYTKREPSDPGRRRSSSHGSRSRSPSSGRVSATPSRSPSPHLPDGPIFAKLEAAAAAAATASPAPRQTPPRSPLASAEPSPPSNPQQESGAEAAAAAASALGELCGAAGAAGAQVLLTGRSGSEVAAVLGLMGRREHGPGSAGGSPRGDSPERAADAGARARELDARIEALEAELREARAERAKLVAV